MPPLVAPPPSCQDYIIVHGWCWFYSEPVNCLEVASVKEICPKGKRGGIIHSRLLCPPLQRVHACGLVVPKLFSLWLACCPRGSPCAFHFHSSLTTVLLNTEPPSSHHPNSTFQLRDLMVPGVSPLPCRQTACWLSPRNRLQHKLSAEEQDALCIFLRPGIQIPFRGCICLIAA